MAALASSAKGKGREDACNCPHCGNQLERQEPLASRSCGSSHNHLSRKESSRLSAMFFELTYMTSLARCHIVLSRVTYESLCTSTIKSALLGGQTPADMRVWLDDEVNVQLFKKHAREGLKTASTDLANMVLATTLDGVYERLTDLVEGRSHAENVPQGPIACSCSLYEHMETIEDLIEGLREQYEECRVTPLKVTVNVGPLKNYIMDQHAKGQLNGADPSIDLAELPGWAGWAKRAIPATLKKMERCFVEALLESVVGNPFKSPHAEEYLEALRDVDGLRLYTLSALRYELALAAKAASGAGVDKGKGKSKAIENGPSSASSAKGALAKAVKAGKTHELEASVALRLSAKGASSEALWQQLGSTVGGLVNSTMPALSEAQKNALPPAQPKGKSKETAAHLAFTARQSAAQAYHAKQYDLALQHCNDAIRYDPDPQHVVVRARVLIQLERYAEAEEDCSWVLEASPDDYKAYFRRALARKAQGKYDAAMVDLEEALAISPDSAEAKAELARLQKSRTASSSA